MVLEEGLEPPESFDDGLQNRSNCRYRIPALFFILYVH